MESSIVDKARLWCSDATRPVSFSGAGLSAESGIDTFRKSQSSVSVSSTSSHDNDSPLWEKFDPVVMASQQGFQDNPEMVIDWYAHRRKTVAAAQPNAAHTALADSGNFKHVTQNVDDLLERAGVTAGSAVHLHGTLVSDQCNSACGYQTEVDMANPPGLMRCPECADSCRPSVVWFGESLPQEDWQTAMQWITDCDLLLVVGTSGVVYPAAGLVELARESSARIIFVDPAVDEHELQQQNQQEIHIQGTAAQVLPKILCGDATKSKI